MSHDPKEPCRCGHTLEWHNACSRCFCAYFLPAAATDRRIIKDWTQARRERERKEQQ